MVGWALLPAHLEANQRSVAPHADGPALVGLEMLSQHQEGRLCWLLSTYRATTSTYVGSVLAYFLNAYWPEHGKDCEEVWKFTHNFIDINTKSRFLPPRCGRTRGIAGEAGKCLDEFESHRFLHGDAGHRTATAGTGTEKKTALASRIGTAASSSRALAATRTRTRHGTC